MFAARREKRENGFDAFAKKWQAVSDHEATVEKEKKAKKNNTTKGKKRKEAT